MERLWAQKQRKKKEDFFVRKKKTIKINFSAFFTWKLTARATGICREEAKAGQTTVDVHKEERNCTGNKDYALNNSWVSPTPSPFRVESRPKWKRRRSMVVSIIFNKLWRGTQGQGYQKFKSPRPVCGQSDVYATRYREFWQIS